MSQGNVGVVREAFDAWNRGDEEGWLKPLHPEIEWSSAISKEVDGKETVWRGEAELRRFWDEWHAVWDMAIEISELRELGDRVLVLARIQVHGKASGVEVVRAAGYVVDFEGDLIRRARAYLSTDEALEAVGLSE
jgi:ketosteroid isomerase-like protein